jgi:hypothetical protein
MRDRSAMDIAAACFCALWPGFEVFSRYSGVCRE